MPIELRECTECRRVYEVLVMRGEAVGVVERQEGDMRISCPGCEGTAFSRLVGVAQLPHINEYPRFDRGLDLMLESEQHRQRVMKERGLVELGNDHEALLRAQRRRWEEEREGRARRKLELESHPAYREYMAQHERQMQDEAAEIKRRAREGRL
jgi:hypothetical protein